MTHTEKLTAMHAHLPRLGLGRYTFAPPIYRLLWRFGIEISPPYFTPFVPLAIFQAVSFGLVMAGLMWFIDVLFPGSSPFSGVGIVKAASLSAVVFGFTIAVVIRLQARRRRLPLWKDYTGR